MRTIIIILCIIATSCATQKRCFDKWATVEERDTTYFRDTTYLVYFKPSDTVYRYGYIRDTVRVSTGLASGQAWTSHDTLFIDVWQTDTIIEYRDSIKIVEREVVTTIEAPPPKIWNKLIILGVLLLLIFIVAKFR